MERLKEIVKGETVSRRKWVIGCSSSSPSGASVTTFAVGQPPPWHSLDHRAVRPRFSQQPGTDMRCVPDSSSPHAYRNNPTCPYSSHNWSDAESDDTRLASVELIRPIALMNSDATSSSLVRPASL